MEDYFKHPAISNSKLDWFRRSPKHFKYFQTHKQEEKPAYLVGSASHCVLFEPDKFKSVFHIIDESKRPNVNQSFAEKQNKKWREDIYEAYAHKSIITQEEYDKVMFMMEELKSHDLFNELVQGCEFEKEHYWKCPITGLDLKKKIDAESNDLIFDYKTTDDADPFIWQKKGWNYHYYRQAGFYTLNADKPFYFVVQEKSPPYGVSIHKCMPDMINYGKDKAMELLRKIKTHIEEDQWPGYEVKTPLASNDLFFEFDIPGWVLQNM